MQILNMNNLANKLLEGIMNKNKEIATAKAAAAAKKRASTDDGQSSARGSPLARGSPSGPRGRGDPDGTTTVTAKGQIYSMYSGVPLPILKAQFAIGAVVPNRKLIALDNRRMWFKQTHGNDVTPGILLYY